MPFLPTYINATLARFNSQYIIKYFYFPVYIKFYQLEPTLPNVNYSQKTAAKQQLRLDWATLHLENTLKTIHSRANVREKALYFKFHKFLMPEFSSFNRPIHHIYKYKYSQIKGFKQYLPNKQSCKYRHWLCLNNQELDHNQQVQISSITTPRLIFNPVKCLYLSNNKWFQERMNIRHTHDVLQSYGKLLGLPFTNLQDFDPYLNKSIYLDTYKGRLKIPTKSSQLSLKKEISKDYLTLQSKRYIYSWLLKCTLQIEDIDTSLWLEKILIRDSHHTNNTKLNRNESIFNIVAQNSFIDKLSPSLKLWLLTPQVLF